MIILTYAMGYVQAKLLSNFDEGEKYGIKEALYTLLCAAIYAGVSILGDWFDGRVDVIIYFFIYVVFAYICGFLVYKIKREIDAKILNDDLKEFQKRRKTNG